MPNSNPDDEQSALEKISHISQPHTFAKRVSQKMRAQVRWRMRRLVCASMLAAMGCPRAQAQHCSEQACSDGGPYDCWEGLDEIKCSAGYSAHAIYEDGFNQNPQEYRYTCCEDQACPAPLFATTAAECKRFAQEQGYKNEGDTFGILFYDFASKPTLFGTAYRSGCHAYTKGSGAWSAGYAWFGDFGTDSEKTATTCEVGWGWVSAADTCMNEPGQFRMHGCCTDPLPPPLPPMCLVAACAQFQSQHVNSSATPSVPFLPLTRARILLCSAMRPGRVFEHCQE